MQQLIDFLNAMPKAEQCAFADRCETTVGYLRKARSVGQKINAETCINIERESHGCVPCEAVRPDIDWWVLRNPQPKTAPALATPAQAAIKTEPKEPTHA